MNKKNLLWGIGAIIIILVIVYVGKMPSKELETTIAPITDKVSDGVATTTENIVEIPKIPAKIPSAKTPAIKTAKENIAPTTPFTNSGRVVFAIKDKAANLNDIRSVFLTVASVKINHPTKGWITVLNSAKEFDLIEIKKSGLLGLLSDVYLEADSYNQLWLTVTKINVQKLDGSVSAANLPSSNIRFPAFSKVVKGETAAIVFDFDIEKSLHSAADNSYLFLPVVETSVQNAVYTNMLGSGKFTFSSGGTPSRVKVGMNENGNISENYFLNPLTEIEFIGNVIKLKPYYLSEEKLAIKAAQAIEIAVNGKYFDSVISIKLLEDEIWQMYGVKNSSNAIIKLEAKTGKIIGI